MPELPEVEVTRRRIAPVLLGRRIESLETTSENYFFITPPSRLRRDLAGRTLQRLDRLGKYLVAETDDCRRLVIHLGMTGQLFSSEARSLRLLSATMRASLAPGEQADFRPDLHTHLQFVFVDGGPEVYMRDVRKFGKVMLLEKGERHPRLERLGVDALEVEGEQLFLAAHKRKVAIKALLLDQSVIAGVGNIYADEALFHAGVRPRRQAARVTRRECTAIAESLRAVLQRSIDTGGSSISDYISPDGEDGAFQDERRVYARKGEACHDCGEVIRRIQVAQRSTHYCPNCQD